MSQKKKHPNMIQVGCTCLAAEGTPRSPAGGTPLTPLYVFRRRQGTRDEKASRRRRNRAACRGYGNPVQFASNGSQEIQLSQPERPSLGTNRQVELACVKKLTRLAYAMARPVTCRLAPRRGHNASSRSDEEAKWCESMNPRVQKRSCTLPWTVPRPRRLDGHRLRATGFAPAWTSYCDKANADPFRSRCGAHCVGHSLFIACVSGLGLLASLLG